MVDTHIRRRAGKSLARPGYSHRHVAQFAGGYNDPMAQTLCGADSTDRDMSWSETQWVKYRAYVTCTECVRIRVEQGVRS